ncbi:EMG1/NEP1 methyltransferase [Helicosporidium sp. ATCC 50920]|nr:EMG1/NEP1 methyltransferase [Helicosporidium sp. ATCC 50920]|eukprot:KDD76821.1 EMG1/NEP1 methyltransferase [Helicosporidium sp. ATCC 50920]
MGGIDAPDAEEELRAAAAGRQSVIFVLEGATLEVAKVGKNYELLNCDDHVSFLKRHGKDPAAYRPDICHQTLLTILDSPLNKAGKIKAVYVHTAKNVLISVNPAVRLPRTLRRFSGLAVQLLQRLSIRAAQGSDRLLRVVKGPVTRLLPADAHRIGFSRAADTLAPASAHVARLDDEKPVVFVLGAFAHGHVDDSYVDQYVAISQYPLSAAYASARLCNALEQKWDIV